MKTELEKMISGEPYMCTDPQLVEMRKSCRNLLRAYNASPDKKILNELFGTKLKNVHIEPSFSCDYGINIELGNNVYFNFNCVILDCAKVKIGSNSFFAPGVHIYTVGHPLDAKERKAGVEFTKPVTIGSNCWIGGGAIILPGVKIGNNSVIGAGTVVTKSVPANSLVLGNPGRVVKKIN